MAGGVSGGLARDAVGWEWRLWLIDLCRGLSGAFSTRLDYWLTQARLWLANAVCDPEP
jgi:hypothetical protein